MTEAREILQKALEISEVLLGKLNFVNSWLQQTEKELETLGPDVLSDRVREMKDMKKEVKEVLSLKQEFVSLCADPSLLVGLKETLTGLESAWSRVQEGLARRLPENEKMGVQDLDLSGEDEYRFTSPANTSLNSSLGEEGMVLQEFRTAFQEISSWLDTAEQQLERTRRESEDRQLGEQILGLQPKVQSLGAMAVEIVEKFNSQRPDVEPEMVILGQRWENIVKKIESSSNFSLVEVEHIKTTIAQLVVPPPDPMTTSLTNSGHSEPEEISTLPEEPQTKGSKRNKDGDSSRDSSPEFFSASPLTPERNGTGSKDTIYTESPLRTTKKTPPATKPKPRWYIESLQDSGSLPSTPGSPASVPPVQQVIVTASTLPSPRSLPSSALPSPRSLSSSGVSSPRSLPSTNTIIEPQRKTTPVPIISPMRTILPSVDTSPSTSPVQSPVVVAPQSVLDDIDKQNERDNAIIDRLLRGTSEDIEDVKARKGYSSSRFQSARENTANHAKEIKEFDEKFTNISLRIATARQRFENLDLETDCGLRNDLIDMELQELEAEVATTISRGDTLVLMVHRFNADQGDDLKERVSQLRQSWANLRKNAEEKKAEFIKEAETLDILKEKLDKMKAWLVMSIKVVRQKKTEEEKVILARKEIDRKMNEMKAIEKLVSTLKSFDRLGTMKETAVSVRSQWGVLKDLATPLRKSKSKSPRETVDKSVPAEIFSRITKMQEALSALRNQLDTSILHGKQFENINLQAEMLERMKAALETLRPKVKKTMSDIDVVSGALSMEYFDKLTALGERLRRDWKEINEDYVDRERTWRECSGELGRFSARAETLSSWISGHEKTILRWKQVKHSLVNCTINCNI